MKLTTINIRGFGGPTKTNLIIRELERTRCDLILLQETHFL